MEVLLFERVSGENLTNNNFEMGATLRFYRNLSATPSTIPETPTKPEREAPPEESPTVAPPSPWAPATKPHECPRPDREGLPFCVYNTILTGVRRSD
jgi:hypothetical protein